MYVEVQGLYAVVDADSLKNASRRPDEFVRELVKQPLTAIQFRSKKGSSRETLYWLRTMCDLARESQIPVYANDRPDLAVLAGCAGVHVGQGDVSVAEVRRLAPSLRVGISTHDLAQVDQALAESPDYVAFGPVFSTSSKLNAEPVVGLQLLASVSRKCFEKKIPLVAIGGIGPRHLGEVGKWANAVALISAFVPQVGDHTTVTSRHQQLLEAMREPSSRRPAKACDEGF